MLKLKYKIWLQDDGRTFGKGVYNLLVGVKKKGSLSEAAKDMGMSYNKAHNLIKNAGKRLGFELLVSKSGGNKGGGSVLTEKAEDFIKNYDEFLQECDKCLQNAFLKYFKN
ncbi:LysR family transcriptional regulator [Clostridium sp. P21]|uniref:LysR family transcriptional regulator n=1 Tax=Clostridium muellerianum TaxID=2716538 RepID=A0A7Y0EFA0_9CLOT|nr:LysR family transcriptional regulator [Clostridium muellerianum]NMM62318.1 LysR family transcriptional regulator [Clostridium muellerianum]